MSFAKDELDEYCKKIILEPSIRNRIVILCEGKISGLKNGSGIKEFSEKEQDASFYYNTIPKWWKMETQGQNEPVFCICGNRDNVLYAYDIIKKKHDEAPEKSYLNPEKLFALVDIDFEKKKLPNGAYKNLDDVYNDLYSDGTIDTSKNNTIKAIENKILTTGFLHKESYFFIPELSSFFEREGIELQGKYLYILNDIPNAGDFSIDKAKKRISHHTLSVKLHDKDKEKSIQEFINAWKSDFQDEAKEAVEKNKLAHILLTIAKSKNTWENIKHPKKPEISKTYRDDLSIEFARNFYAKEPIDSLRHIPSLFRALAYFLKNQNKKP
ncbi:MAG: hypothetical protein RIR79_1937 [Pseudomonadota bacterium]|jgi:hypothetical protein